MPQARIVLDETRHCTEPVAAEAERRVLAGLDPEQLAGWTARRLRSRLRAAVLAAEAALDAEHTVERERTARDARRVSVRPEPDGMESLWALLPAEQLRTFTVGLDLLAARQREVDRASGVVRTADQRRADLLALLPGLALHALDGTAPPAGGGHPSVVVHVHVPMATALGLSDEPGDLAGYGPISAGTVRLLLPDARLRRVLVEAGTGKPLHADSRTTAPASTRASVAAPGGVPAPEPAAGRADDPQDAGLQGRGERDSGTHTARQAVARDTTTDRPERAVAATTTGRAECLAAATTSDRPERASAATTSDRPERPAAATTTGRADRADRAERAAAARSTDRALREALLGMLEDRPFLLDETPEPQYRPSRPLRRLVHLRDQHCCGPGCSRTVRSDDLDHRVPWPLGPTSAANLAPLSRRCHRAKTTAWSLRREPDGSHRWTSPVGRQYLVPPPWRPPPEPRLPRPLVATAGRPPPVDSADDGLSDQLDVPPPPEPRPEQTAPRTAPGDDPPPF